MPVPRQHSISLLRPLRPPSIHHARRKPPSVRVFTQNSQLLLVSPPTPRPQLPFLATTSFRAQRHARLQQHLNRYLSTDTRRWLKDQVKLGMRYTLYGWTAMFLVSIMLIGYYIERADRSYPSPKEWTFSSKHLYRRARSEEEEDVTEWEGRGIVDWARVQSTWLNLLPRLEDPGIEGKGVVPLDTPSEVGVPQAVLKDLGIKAFDISTKNEEWIRAYHTVLMGIAKAAERLQDDVKDMKRYTVWPKDMVIGPSNPNPRPVPPGSPPAPFEEDVLPASEPPETYYNKLLLTKGFDTRQRLEAALAYADWLDFSGKSSSAEELYKWAVNLASSTQPSKVIDNNFILQPHSQPSANLITAVTALAVHHARQSNISAALPIFISVLRARREAPLVDSPKKPYRPTSSDAPMDALRWYVSKSFTPAKFPPPPPSGDTPLIRTPADECEEAAVMMYIGEILYASENAPASDAGSRRAQGKGKKGAIGERESGINYTRQAHTLALERARDAGIEVKQREKCLQCADASLKNLHAMVQRLAREERAKEGPKPGATVLATSTSPPIPKTATVGQSDGKKSSWLSWWASDDNALGDAGDFAPGEGRWTCEEREVEEMVRKEAREGLWEMVQAQKRPFGWFGVHS